MNRKSYSLCLISLIAILAFVPSSNCEQILINEEVADQSNIKSHAGSIQQNCTEFYPRLFYTQERSRYIIKFNTLDKCSKSYVTINQDNSISKFYCESSLLRIEQKTVFIRYIQSCIATVKQNQLQFNYSVYGKPLNSTLKDSIKLYRINIPQSSENFNMVVTADWGPMQVRTYQPIYPSLRRVINDSSRPIHALVLIGDLAYNLNTNECNQYELFMNQLSVISPYVPIIPIYGNHDSDSPSNIEIFRLSFQCYNLSSNLRVQSYQFWNFKLITFNPYLEIYQKSSEENFSLMKNVLFKDLTENTLDKFVVLSSHYPVICSQNTFHCRQTMLVLSEFYKQISKLNTVDLYLGAHMHQYERIVPYHDGQFITDRRGPYKKGEMPSIVEGVAGCDVGIIDQQYQVQSFSVSHSYNKTGYGVLSISSISRSPNAQYIHYVTPSSDLTIQFDRVKFSIDKITRWE